MWKTGLGSRFLVVVIGCLGWPVFGVAHVAPQREVVALEANIDLVCRKGGFQVRVTRHTNGEVWLGNGKATGIVGLLGL